MRRSRYEPQSTINITSLLDVTFMLLIMFIIATPIMQAQIDISLPTSKTAIQTDEEMLEVTINKDGQVFIEQKSVAWEDLVRRLKYRKESDNVTSVAIRGAGEVEYSQIMRIIDAIKEAEISNLGLVALPEK